MHQPEARTLVNIPVVQKHTAFCSTWMQHSKHQVFQHGGWGPAPASWSPPRTAALPALAAADREVLPPACPQTPTRQLWTAGTPISPCRADRITCENCHDMTRLQMWYIRPSEDSASPTCRAHLCTAHDDRSPSPSIGGHQVVRRCLSIITSLEKEMGSWRQNVCAVRAHRVTAFTEPRLPQNRGD